MTFVSVALNHSTNGGFLGCVVILTSTLVMVKAFRWITAGIFFIGLWLGLLYDPFNQSLSTSPVILYLPVILIMCFGIFSAFFVIYKAATFNDLPDEARYLEQQIREARKSLERAGFQF